MRQHTVEQQLDVHFRIHSVRIGEHGGVAVGRGLGEIGPSGFLFVGGGREVQLPADVCGRGVHECCPLFDDDDVVEQLFHVLHLVGGNHDAALFVHLADEQFAELALAGNVHAVGGFVQDEPRGAGGEGEAEQHLLFLPHGKLAEFEVFGQTEHPQVVPQVLVVELRIEGSVEADILFQRIVRQVELFGDEVEVAERFRQTAADVHAVEAHFSGGRREQSRHQVEQGGLSGPVLSQQSIYIPLLQVQGEVVENAFLPFGVSKGEVVDGHHTLAVF